MQLLCFHFSINIYITLQTPVLRWLLLFVLWHADKSTGEAIDFIR